MYLSDLADLQASIVTAVTSSLYLFWSLALPCKAYSITTCTGEPQKFKPKKIS
jgi:hypothetical protein